VAGEWRKLHNELHNLYSSPDFVTVIKSRRMKWVGHVTCLVDTGNAYRFWLEELKGRDHLEDLGMDGSIILEWILGTKSEKLWNVYIYGSG
jgi:hypothetical protein